MRVDRLRACNRCGADALSTGSDLCARCEQAKGRCENCQGPAHEAICSTCKRRGVKSTPVLARPRADPMKVRVRVRRWPGGDDEQLRLSTTSARRALLTNWKR